MDLSIVLQWVLCFTMVLFPVTTADTNTIISSSSSSITLKSSGNATLDAPIWFTATYMDFKEDNDLLYEWRDDLWNYHQEPMLTRQSNWSLIYDSETYDRYTGIRKVTVKVKKWRYLTIASADIHFHLSSYLIGALHISQTNVSIITPGYISTGNPTNLTANVDDPYDWLKKRTLFATFLWVINNRIVATCNTPSLLINLTEPQVYQIQTTVYLDLSSEIITTTPASTTTTSTVTTHIPTTVNQTTTATISPRSSSSTQQPTTTSSVSTETTAKPPPPNNRTWICSGWWPSITGEEGASQGGRNYGLGEIDFSKFGTFSNSTKAREPIGTLNVTGSQWLKRGQLLNLTIQCSGSGPWTYCVFVHRGSYNVTGNETCSEPLVTTLCDFELIHLFKRNGTFTYIIIISNEVSTQIQAVPITIYNVDRKHQLSYIIVPVSCSLVVIIIIIFGSAYLFQSRQRYLVEVADFDFEVCDDVIYNKTICEMLHEAFATALFTKNDELEDDDNRWRESSRIVESPKFFDSGNQYGSFHS